MTQTQKKYEFTGETKQLAGRTLHRIRRLSDGVIGGWIEAEKNLSHEGTCWVSGNAQVYGNAQVSDNAKVYGNAKVYSNAQVYGNAQVFGNAKVYGNALVYGDAWVYGNAKVYGNALVLGDAQVSDNAQVYGNAQVSDNAKVYGDAVATSAVEFLRLTRDPITVTDKHIAIGCEMHLITDWLELGFIQKIGEKHGYSKENIKIYTQAIKLAATLRGIK